ncbi:TonB-dependent receptor-like protein [Sphingobium sp. SYK-6]|uniref:TonB-dependent receptor n=1 Tax=Sphingobium sp. (strain NBRC 103272 / SYK-6) TaxID=627192 RepID=UPI0002277564|nr:TonB-dependent receptor [Sphingobium sp. SYK-6]BAK66646.1 TonB-dependent receptor-like protein [Sphingobium sp. SYK-6]
MRAVRSGFLIGIAVSALIAVSPASAQADKSVAFDLPAQPRTEALRKVAREGGLEFSAPADPLRAKKSKRLKGTYTIEDAARRLLAGTPLTADVTDGALIVRESSFTAKNDRSENGENEIIVTGSHLKSAESASPTITIRASDVALAGQTDLGEAIRSLPQNFSGGQNPGVASGANGIANQNLDASSTPNLRGLGGDATLVLLNGHRLSYGSFVQAVDISAVPLASVERIDVVADGTSAIYGSDAVGGVVNIILKHAYDGVNLTATLGGATDGGNFLQQYSGVAGRTWNSGGVVLSYSHQANAAIFSNERNYTAYMPEGGTIYPRVNQDSVVASAHQTLSSTVDFNIDAAYSNRRSFMAQATDYGVSYVNRPDVTSYSVTPSLRIGLATGWEAHVSATYGESKLVYDQETLNNSSASSRSTGFYKNRIVNPEGYVTGSIGDVIAHPIELVFGAGYRYNSYRYAPSTASFRYGGSINSYYGFSEFKLPFIAPEDASPLGDRLILNAALRYERYPRIASVAVPKLGLIYGASPDFDLKVTWGKSFKAPTLDQRYQLRGAYLDSTSYMGGERFPAGSTVLTDYGGNTDLKPERANTWSATIDLHPRAVDGLHASATYFHISYRDRIIQPVSGAAMFTALADPAYDPVVNYSPTFADIENILSNAAYFYNFAGSDDRSKIVAIINSRYTNAAHQMVQGIDLVVDYKLPLPGKSSVTVSANGAWLWSDQNFTGDSAKITLAGAIFNPPRFRARGSAVWSDKQLTLSAYVNHLGGLSDNRQSPSVRVGTLTTLDMSARYKIPQGEGSLGGLALQVSAQNIFNQRPPYAAPSGGYSYYVNYDSTNFSPIGRFVSFTISKDW